jgi:hypothetical protein
MATHHHVGEDAALLERPGIVKRHGKTTERPAVREDKMGLFAKRKWRETSLTFPESFELRRKFDCWFQNVGFSPQFCGKLSTLNCVISDRLSLNILNEIITKPFNIMNAQNSFNSLHFHVPISWIGAKNS